MTSSALDPRAPDATTDAAALDATTLDAEQIRADFPILHREVNGRPLIYLDSAATSQRPQRVIDAEVAFLTSNNAAVHRGAHTLAAEATDLYEDARETVAGFVGADADSLVWTHGATEALNLVAGSIGAATAGRAPGGGAGTSPLALRPGDEIVTTEIEHHANLIPWQELAARTGAVLRHIPAREDGTLDLEAASRLVGPKTRVLAFTHVSNVLGIVNPVEELVALAHAHGAIAVLDACQSLPHLPLDLPALGVDLAAFSAHKMQGPYGVGGLYGRPDVLAQMPPLLTGGSMVTTVGLDETHFLEPPQRFEAGTQPVSQAIAWAEAARYLQEIGLDRIAEHERRLERRMRDGLRGIPGIRLLGDAEGVERVGIAAFDVEGVHAHDAGQFLDSRGIAVRVGHHCAAPLHARYGMTASVRASAALYNTDDDVDAMLEAVSGVRGFFGA